MAYIFIKKIQNGFYLFLIFKKLKISLDVIWEIYIEKSVIINSVSISEKTNSKRPKLVNLETCKLLFSLCFQSEKVEISYMSVYTLNYIIN